MAAERVWSNLADIILTHSQIPSHLLTACQCKKVIDSANFGKYVALKKITVFFLKKILTVEYVERHMIEINFSQPNCA